MNDDDPADRLARASRVSIRAVFIPDGRDPATALAEAGIVDPISVGFMTADESLNSGLLLGDGRTPNLIATLELDKDDRLDPAAVSSQPGSHPPPDAAQPREVEPPETTTLPAAYGINSLAPVRKRPL